jgi:Flp pilus assembly protein TadG
MTKNVDIKSRTGQTTVELTMLLPILFVILFGIIQFGITYKDYLALTDSVRAGARTAAVSRLLAPADRTSAIQTKVKASADLDWTKPGAGITVASDWQVGDDVVVRATYPYSINLFGFVVTSGNLSSSTTERVE